MFTPKDRKAYDEKMLNRIYTKDDCPFCDPAQTEGQILWKGKKWFIVHNLYSYSGDRDHIMAVPFVHKNFSHQLDLEELAELAEVYRIIKEYYGEKHYFSCTRETFANRSVEHYHMHFMPGALEGKYLRKMLEGQGFPIHEDFPR